MTNDTDGRFVAVRTDKYFTKTKTIVKRNGEVLVVYAVFQRSPVMAATKLAVELINKYCPEASVTVFFEDGEFVPALAKVMEIMGPMSRLVELETLYLRELGFTQVAALNTYNQCMASPNTPMLDMHGRHATGDGMTRCAAYGASVGSARAQRDGAKGFVATSNDITAHYYGDTEGRGTQPHALIGYAKVMFPDFANATLKATQLYVEAYPGEQSLTSLVDYDGLEISDALEIAEWFYNDPEQDGKTWGVRLDTHGGRYAEGLDYDTSVDIVANHLGITDETGRFTREFQIMEIALKGVTDGTDDGGNYFDVSEETYDKVWKMMIGKGVSAANIINQRNQFDAGGYTEAQIVASSGFNVLKCQVMHNIGAPIDVIGSGSFLPSKMSETYATSDIISYNGVASVKVGREWLFGEEE